MNKWVSVIIPSYGGAENIEKCVESVLNQTYANTECIVVDDNGVGTPMQKETEQRLKKFLNNSRFQYICHKVNKNGSAARNTGAKAAKGEYYCFLDDDDFFYPERVERQVKQLEELGSNYGVSYCSCVDIVNGAIVGKNIVQKSGNILEDLLLQNIRIGSSHIMVPKKIYDELGGFDESFVRHQDWEFLTRLLARYDAAALPYIGDAKVNIGRNVPKTPDQAAEFRLYFLQKMKPIIDSCANSDKIYKHQYIEIAKPYFYFKDFRKYNFYAKKSGDIVQCLWKSLKYTVHIWVNQIKNRRAREC